MKLRFISVLLLAVVVVSGCRKTAAPPAPGGAPNAAPGLPQLAQVQGGTTPAQQTKYFKGSIGSSLDLQMKLVRADPQLSGSYFYQRVGTRINLRGTIDPDGKFVLEEFDPAGKQTGVFKGMWTVDAQDGTAQLAGFWSRPGQKETDKSTAFSVHEEPISFSGDAEIVAKSIKENNKQLNYEIDVQYPRLHVAPIRLEDVFDDLFIPLARDGAAILEVGIRLQKAFITLSGFRHPEFKRIAVQHSRSAIKRAEATSMIEEDLDKLRRIAGLLGPA